MIISKLAKRPSKQDAFAMVEKLKNGRTLTDVEVDSLLLYFAPATPKSENVAEKWVALAAGKNDKRDFINYLHVIDGVMYGMDGARIHKCKTNFANGTYNPKTLLKTDALILPAYVFNVVKSYFNKTAFNNVKISELTLAIKSENYNFATLSDNEILINRQFATEAANGNDDFVLSYNEQCAYGKHALGQFCIMLMRK